MFEKVDFVGGWKMWFALSGVLLLASIAAIAFGRLNLGIDFQGGAQFTVTGAQGQLSADEVRAALPDGVARESTITTLGENGYEVRTPVLSQEETQRVRDSLSKTLEAEVSVT